MFLNVKLREFINEEAKKVTESSSKLDEDLIDVEERTREVLA